MSDSNDDCNSLACKGGKKLTCFRYFDQKWAGKGVDCGYKINYSIDNKNDDGWPNLNSSDENVMEKESSQQQDKKDHRNPKGKKKGSGFWHNFDSFFNGVDEFSST